MTYLSSARAAQTSTDYRDALESISEVRPDAVTAYCDDRARGRGRAPVAHLADRYAQAMLMVAK